MESKKKSIIYIDGFNLYYGALKGSKNKWLDLSKYFHTLRQADDIQVIKYFTALVDQGAHQKRQQTYLNALNTLPDIEIILGKFKSKQVKCLIPCNAPNKIFSMPEEKRTDVNIAIHLLNDAFLNLCDRFIIVSGDSDLVPALEMIKRTYLQKEIIVYIPASNPFRGAAVEMRSIADKHRTLPLNLLHLCQFQNTIPFGTGGQIVKPAEW